MSGTFQFSGLISGIDSSKIIDQLMALERQPLQRLQQQQQTLQDRKAAYAALADKLSALQAKTFNLLLSTTTQGRTATSSNTNVATATASPNTAIQSFTLNVTSLATKTSVTSPTQIGQAIDPNVPLANAGFGTTPTSGSFTINGVSITVNAATDTLNDVINRINTTPGLTATASLLGNTLQLSDSQPIVVGSGGDTSNFLQVTKLAAAPSVETPPGSGTFITTSTGPLGVANPSATLANARLATTLATTTGSFTINGVTISWDSSVDSINSIVSKINSSGAKVTASYDPNTDTFRLEANDTGSAQIALTDNGGSNLLTALKVTGTQSIGTNAAYSVNGGPTQYSTSNAITNLVPGVNATLSGTGTTTITIAQDTASAVSAVKDFITAFNDALTLVRQDVLVDPKTNKASIFTGDAFIEGLEFQLRAVVDTADTSLTTQFKTLPGIGISSGPVGSIPGTTNSLVLDEAKLTQALQSDPNAVTALLTDSNGPVGKLNSFLRSVTSFTGPLQSGQTSADQEISDLSQRITDLQERLDQRQQALEQQFAALEQAMAQLQTQSAQLAGQLGQLIGAATQGR